MNIELNKIAGAVLATGLLVFGLKIVGGALFSGESPHKPGFMIATAEAQSSEKAAEGPAVSVGTLLAKADKGAGEGQAKACMACHSLEKGGANKVGPALWDVVGRKIASAEGFAYSDGLKAMNGKNWDYEALNGWIKNPKGMVSGTKMAYGGLGKDQARADLLAYLGSLSDAPKPFPAP